MSSACGWLGFEEQITSLRDEHVPTGGRIHLARTTTRPLGDPKGHFSHDDGPFPHSLSSPAHKVLVSRESIWFFTSSSRNRGIIE